MGIRPDATPGLRLCSTEPQPHSVSSQRLQVDQALRKGLLAFLQLGKRQTRSLGLWSYIRKTTRFPWSNLNGFWMKGSHRCRSPFFKAGLLVSVSENRILTASINYWGPTTIISASSVCEREQNSKLFCLAVIFCKHHCTTTSGNSFLKLWNVRF